MAENDTATSGAPVTHETIVEDISMLARQSASWPELLVKLDAYADTHRTLVCLDCGERLGDIIDTLIQGAKEVQNAGASLKDFADSLDLSLLLHRAPKMTQGEFMEKFMKLTTGMDSEEFHLFISSGGTVDPKTLQ